MHFAGDDHRLQWLATTEFNITTGSSTVKTIFPRSLLPTITDNVTIDGYTQPGAEPNDAATNANSAVLKIQLSGTLAPANAFGLAVSGADASGTTIKGLVINRFRDDGIFINAPNTTIEGNFIGTASGGTIDRGNGADRVNLPSSGNVIGGPANAAQNVISGNGANGVAVRQSSATNNTISNNHIGTDADAGEDLGNTESGVFVENAPDNTIGGSTADGALNIISGNNQHGVEISNIGASGTRVLGNLIGVNLNGNGFSNIGNTLDGVRISSTPQTEIGTSSTFNKVQGNRIGTNINGSAAFGNVQDGVLIGNFSSTTIGGTTEEARDVISGNTKNGVFISGTNSATNNQIQGNFIGINAAGTGALGNDEVGVRVETPNNFVGGTAAGAGNVISDNGGTGVSILAAGVSNATNTKVEGNLIGTDANGAGALGNFHGVFISGAPGNVVGGTVAEAANTISGNDNNGVMVLGGAATGNSILRNSISANGTPNGLGIALNNDGVTANDPRDPDRGPNRLQNFPVIDSASTTTISGRLNSRPNKTFTIQFFSNPAPNIPTLFGEGETFLGETTVTTDDRGRTSFTFATSVNAGEFVASTATNDSTGDTSEFSAAREVEQ